MTQPFQAASFHHLPILKDVLRYLEVKDSDPPGGRLLVFLDENGAQVTIRLLRTTADRLLKILGEGPIKAQ